MTQTAETATTYDLVPYPGNPYRDTHPDHLSTIARLFALESPPVERARVLELGCACGNNLIPMAESLPDAQFTGIDLSVTQIDLARNLAVDLGVTNIEWRAGSIADIGPADGLFDYIICHGVFSWVPLEVREHILRVCSNNLSPTGVAYISYNTYPGWFMRGMVRRMMGFHARKFNEPSAQLEQARALLDFLAESCTGGDSAYQALLNRELQILKQCNDSYLFHEHLEDVNEPLFFHEFVELAEHHGLRYLAEPHLKDMVATNIPEAVQQVLRRLGANIIHYEQYLDFLQNRTFRRTLLCHAGQIPLREITPERMAPFRIVSQLKRDVRQEGEPAEGWVFSSGALSATVQHPLHKGALTHLEQAGLAGIRCAELPGKIAEWMRSSATENAVSEMQDFVLQLYLQGLLEIALQPPRFSTQPGPRPRTSAGARRQASEGGVVTNLRHERVALPPLERAMLQLLDGHRGPAELQDELQKLLSGGTLTVSTETGPLTREQTTPALLQALLDHSLRSLASQALLFA